MIHLEALLGRRARPWWGMSPLKLLVRAVVQGAVSVLVFYGALVVRSDRFDFAEYNLEQSEDTLTTIAAVVAVLAALLTLYSVARIIVAVIDLLTRVPVDGMVVSVEERKRGDILPQFVQDWIWSRGDRQDLRVAQPQLVLQTAAGLRSWRVSYSAAARIVPGERVRLVATPLIGHVTSIEPQEE